MHAWELQNLRFSSYVYACLHLMTSPSALNTYLSALGHIVPQLRTLKTNKV